MVHLRGEKLENNKIYCVKTRFMNDDLSFTLLQESAKIKKKKRLKVVVLQSVKLRLAIDFEKPEWHVM